MVYKRLERILIQLDAVDSTNNYAAHLLKSTKVSSGTVIFAKDQQHGRGQRSNVWTSQAGKNLTCSLIFFPSIQIKDAFYLNLATSLAVRKTLSDLGVAAQIKWPNDILVKGNKICGILIENQINGRSVNSSIIGIGLNVNQLEFGAQVRATSLKKELGREIEVDVVFDQLYGYLDFYLNLLLESNWKLLKKHYYEHLYQKGILAKYEDVDGVFEGIIEGIDDTGRLQLRKNGVLKSYDLKELIYC